MKNEKFDELFDAAKNGNREKLEQARESLSEEQKRTVKKALEDREFLNSLLSSEKAKEIIRKLKSGGK